MTAMRDRGERLPSNDEPAALPRKGLMLVLSSPSGAGKTSLARRLLSEEAGLAPSVSVTTRPRRANETDGVDYIFKSREQFMALREAGELLEWAEVFGNLYGTPKAPVETALNAGSDVLFDIDWQGGAQLRAAAPDDVVSVFILPPSAEVLRHRLQTRALDSAEVIQTRLTGASREIEAWRDYTYVIVNDNFEESLANLRAIIRAERLRRARRRDLEGLVARIQADL
jgi:guanylate kinase